MGTYSRPGTGVSPYMIDRSAELISKQLDTAGTDLIKQKENIRISQNQGAEEIAKLKKGINNVGGGDELTFKDKSIDMLNEEVDNLDLLMRNSIGRDQTEYIKARTNLMGLPELYTKTLTLLDSKSEEYNGIADQARQILNSTSTEARAFMNDIANNDGNNITPSYKNGNLILTYNGKDDQGRDQEYVLNANNWIKANNSGTGNIINYSKIGEHEKEWGTLVDNTMKSSNLKPEVIKSIKEIGGGKINTKTVENYLVAKESLTKRLLENTNLLPTLDESTWQFFHPGEEWNPKDKDDIDKLKGEVVEYLVDQKLGLDEVTTSQVESFRRRQGSSSKGSGKEAPTTIDHSDFISGLNKYNDLIKSDTGLQTPDFSDSLRKQRIQYLTDYLMKKNALFKGDNAAVLAQNKKADPNSYYEYTDPGNTYKDAYTIVDVEKVFTDAVFEDPASLERKLNRYIKGGTSGTSRANK